MRRFIPWMLALSISGALCAQTPQMTCSERDDNRSYCEIKEMPATAAGRITVDGRANGGISVKGWDRADVLVRAKIEARADSVSEAKALAAQVSVSTANAEVRASGPDSTHGRSWWVSYEVFVPHRTSVTAKTHNGGVKLADLSGEIEFSATNGGVKLERLAGRVHGATTNGGLHVELAGAKWDGEGMDVSTTNGGVSLSVPANYSARLEAATTNGGISVDFPVTVSGLLRHSLSTTLGSGGALIKVVTTNGGVRVKRQA